MTRLPAPDRRPVTLTIAGSDSGGGAGIQADLKTMEAFGTFATSVVTSVTAQHTLGVESAHVLPVSEVVAQFDAVTDDFDVQAAKTGMLATTPIVDAVTERLRDFDGPVVVDPVMVATSGDRLLDRDAESAYESLIREATLVTPNVDEAAVLTGIEPTDEETMYEAAEALRDLGAESVLLKGGHIPGSQVIDLLLTTDGVQTFSHARIDTDATHGSGCTLSSAITSRLALGDSLVDAVDRATAFMERALRYHSDVGRGPGSVHHMVDVRERAARTSTSERVESIVDRLVEADVSAIVPEVGMQVVGATPYSEQPVETAAVEGRITRTLTGVRPNRGVRFGASSHIARLLLTVREYDPTIRFAANCRFDSDVEAAIDTLGWDVAGFDRSAEPTSEAEARTMQWGTMQALEQADETPTAIVDRGDVGKEPMTRLIAVDEETLAKRIITLAETV